MSESMNGSAAEPAKVVALLEQILHELKQLRGERLTQREANKLNDLLDHESAIPPPEKTS